MAVSKFYLQLEMFVSLTMKKRAVTLLMFRVNTVVFGLEILRLSSSQTTHMEELEGEGFIMTSFDNSFVNMRRISRANE